MSPTAEGRLDRLFRERGGAVSEWKGKWMILDKVVVRFNELPNFTIYLCDDRGTQRRNKQNHRTWQNNGQSESLPFRNKTQHVSVSLQPFSPRFMTAQFCNKFITCLADWPTGLFFNETSEKSVSRHVAPQFCYNDVTEWQLITVFFSLFQMEVSIIVTVTLNGLNLNQINNKNK